MPLLQKQVFHYATSHKTRYSDTFRRHPCVCSPLRHKDERAAFWPISSPRSWWAPTFRAQLLRVEKIFSPGSPPRQTSENHGQWHPHWLHHVVLHQGHLQGLIHGTRVSACNWEVNYKQNHLQSNSGARLYHKQQLPRKTVLLPCFSSEVHQTLTTFLCLHCKNP